MSSGANTDRRDSMESIVAATDDGGLIITWERDGREASVTMPRNRAIVYYAAYSNGSRVSVGCVETHEAVENLWRWVAGDPWCATDLVEGGR